MQLIIGSWSIKAYEGATVENIGQVKVNLDEVRDKLTMNQALVDAWKVKMAAKLRKMSATDRSNWIKNAKTRTVEWSEGYTKTAGLDRAEVEATAKFDMGLALAAQLADEGKTKDDVEKLLTTLGLDGEAVGEITTQIFE